MRSSGRCHGQELVKWQHCWQQIVVNRERPAAHRESRSRWELTTQGVCTTARSEIAPAYNTPGMRTLTASRSKASFHALRFPQERYTLTANRHGCNHSQEVDRLHQIRKKKTALKGHGAVGAVAGSLRWTEWRGCVEARFDMPGVLAPVVSMVDFISKQPSLQLP